MHPLRSGDVLGGDYRIERALGSGGMGTLYVATQLSTGKKRALKLLRPELLADPSLRERFEREARVGASIESDHVVDVIAAGIDEASGAPWLAMELLDGEDLATFLSRRGPLPPELACDIVAQLTHAMGAAHAAGVVHRDLKPENVFIASARREGAPLLVKVLDFGIAKVLRSGGPTGTAAIGTLAWMAPEQTDERGEIGPPTDIWALGLIVFNVLTGARYWPDASMSILARKLLVDPLLSASERAAELGRSGMLPGGFDGWFGRCVARDPKDRFGSASDARVALERVLRHTGAEPTIAHAPPTISRAPARRAEQRWRIPGEGSPRRGPESALVTVVQFADFECPYSMAAEGIVREILDTHGDDVAIVWKDVPYDAHPAAHARLASRASPGALPRRRARDSGRRTTACTSPAPRAASRTSSTSAPISAWSAMPSGPPSKARTIPTRSVTSIWRSISTPRSSRTSS
ncbi:MAG: protein kinase [bacterium]